MNSNHAILHWLTGFLCLRIVCKYKSEKTQKFFEKVVRKFPFGLIKCIKGGERTMRKLTGREKDFLVVALLFLSILSGVTGIFEFLFKIMLLIMLVYTIVKEYKNNNRLNVTIQNL